MIDFFKDHKYSNLSIAATSLMLTSLDVFYIPIKKINKYENHPFTEQAIIQKMAAKPIHPSRLTC
jgi:hypothetical protein